MDVQAFVAGTPLAQATSFILDSGSWKFIVQSKDKALMYMKRIIGDGSDTSLWFDPWLQEGTLIQ